MARSVFIIGPWALKFAWNSRGRQRNRFQSELFTSADDRRRAMLCPVKWCSLGGWVLVMAAATPITRAERDYLVERSLFPDWAEVSFEQDSPFDYAASDWGWLLGRLVALDYAASAFENSLC